MQNEFLTINKNNIDRRGVSIVELLVVCAVLIIGFTALSGSATLSLKILNSAKETEQANFFAKEIMEQARNFRDGILWNQDDPENKYDGLGIITNDIAYHLEKSADSLPKWQLLQGEEVLPGGFSRKIVFGATWRDSATDNIESPGDYLDPDAKKATATVSWKGKKIEIVSYLTNWR